MAVNNSGRKPKLAGTQLGFSSSIAELEQRKRCEPFHVEIKDEDFIPPSELDKVALAHWHELVAIFKRFRGNAVDGSDRRLLQIACETWSDIEFCNERLRENREPMIWVTNKDGKEQYVKNPFWERREKARTNYILVCDRIQLTPTSRAKIGKARADSMTEKEDDFF